MTDKATDAQLVNLRRRFPESTFDLTIADHIVAIEGAHDTLVSQRDALRERLRKYETVEDDA